MTPADVISLIGPRPPSRTRAYFKWKYRYDKILTPARYERTLARKRKPHV